MSSHGTIIPIYDDRIPEEYKVDANDNMKLIHGTENAKVEKIYRQRTGQKIIN